MDEFFEVYVEETKEHLNLLNEYLLKLEQNPEDKDIINEIFRSAHTIKGSSAAMGFMKLENLTHGMEDVLQDIRDGKILADKKIIDLLFVCHDLLENCMDSVVSIGSEGDIKIDNMLNNLHLIINEKQQGNIIKDQQGNMIKEQQGLDDFILDLDVWKSINEYISAGFIVYKIKADIDENSPFKSIDAWVIFQAIEKCLKIFKSDPPVPTIEEFQSNQFNFDGNFLNIFVVSDKLKEQLFTELKETIPNVKHLEVESIKVPSEVSNITHYTPLRLVDNEEGEAYSAVDEIVGFKNECVINIDKVFFNDFTEEINAQIDKIEANLGAVETNLERKDLVKGIFNSFHTIEGLSGFICYDNVKKVSKQTGNLIEEYLKRDINLDENLFALILSSMDFVRSYFNGSKTDKKIDEFKEIEECAKEIEAYLYELPVIETKEIFDSELDKNFILDEDFANDISIQASNEETKEEEIDPNLLESIIEEINDYADDIISNISLLDANTKKEEIIITLLKSFHSICGVSDIIKQNNIKKIAIASENLTSRVQKNEINISNKFIQLLNKSINYIKSICSNLSINESKEFLMTIEEHCNLIESYFDDLQIQTVEETKTLVETVAVAEHKEAKPTTRNSEGALLRIPVSKADNMVNMLGELMILQSLIQQQASEVFDSNDKFMNNLSRAAKIIKDLQNVSLSLRMVSLKTTFQKLLRIVRDTAIELNKNVDISVSGEDTEIDRNVAEKILDPLMHLLRNAVSHGIEDEAERMQKGKSSEGHVSLKAYSKRGNVYIEVSDDGKGLSVEKILKKAKEKNLVKPDVKYSNDEIIKFIFLPGFSTQETINNISGRGVGMNVVEAEITKINGKVEIETEVDKGTSFILKIPINMAVMNGTIVSINNNKYIIPTVYIKQILNPLDVQWVNIKGKRQLFRYKDEIIKIIPIDSFLTSNNSENEDATKMLVIVEVERKLKAIPVSNIYGRQEIVVKPLGNEFKNFNFLSGASILGDGKVSLILDIEVLFNSEEVDEND